MEAKIISAMNRLLVLAIASTLMAFLLSGCFIFCQDCGQDKDAPTYKLEQEFKDYVLFPIGSYWIYYESALQEIDSVYLYDQEIRVNKSQKIFPYNYEQLDQNQGSSYFNDSLFGGSSTEKYFGQVINLYAERYLSNPNVTNLQFFNNVEAGTTLDFSEISMVTYLGEIETYAIGSSLYINVRVFENLIEVDGRLPRKIYYAPNIGIIRKELFNGQVWNLKRYYVNQ